MTKSQASRPLAPLHRRLVEVDFLAFLTGRPDDEKWELIDGEPIQKMNPASIIHNRIAANLERELNKALAQTRPELDALREAALSWDGDPFFRPIADVAVVPAAVAAADGSPYFFNSFFLAAEVLSPSNRHRDIGRKRELYAAAPNCLHVLVIAQDETSVEIWSRTSGWERSVFRSPEDVIALPEFGFTCRVAALYKGTPLL